jgi:hypothetical protein
MAWVRWYFRSPASNRAGPRWAAAHYVRVYLAQLQQEIEADPARPRLLLTELGIGYRSGTNDTVGTR